MRKKGALGEEVDGLFMTRRRHVDRADVNTCVEPTTYLHGNQHHALGIGSQRRRHTHRQTERQTDATLAAQMSMPAWNLLRIYKGTNIITPKK